MGIFNYRFLSRHAALLGTAGWLLMGVAVTCWVNSVNPDARMIHGIYFWIGLLSIAALFLWGWQQTRVLMQPVTVTDRGIAGDLRPERPRFRAVPNPGFIEFDSITEIAMLAKPDLDADSRRWGVSAIRIRAPNKKIVVWKVIQDFDRLCALIESEMSRHGKPLRISPKDVEIPAGTGMATVLFP